MKEGSPKEVAYLSFLTEWENTREVNGRKREAKDCPDRINV